MKMITMLFFICALSVGNVNAASLSISFPSFNGNYIYPNAVVSEAFDFGVQFSSIESAELTIEASGTAGLLQICDIFTSRCATERYGPNLVWGFSLEPGHDLVFGSLNLTNTITPYTLDITPKSSFLLDGTGELYIQPNFIYSIPEVVVTVLQPSTYQISNVVLNVKGTVVPAPPALLLFLSGLAGLVGIKKFKHEMYAQH
jgi:hypothetical protein